MGQGERRDRVLARHGLPNSAGNRRVRPWQWIALGLLAVAAAMLLLDRLALALEAERPLVLRLGSLASRLGDAALPLVPLGLALVGLGLATWKAHPRARLRLVVLAQRLAFAFMAIAGPSLAVSVAKRLIGRVRPHHAAAGDVFDFAPFHWSARAASLPSGHAATVAATAAVLVLLFGRRALVPGLALVLLVGWSRLALGAHFLSDVLAGVLVGAGMAWWLADALARHRLVFRHGPDGGILLRPLPAIRSRRG